MVRTFFGVGLGKTFGIPVIFPNAAILVAAPNFFKSLEFSRTSNISKLGIKLLYILREKVWNSKCLTETCPSYFVHWVDKNDEIRNVYYRIVSGNVYDGK